MTVKELKQYLEEIPDDLIVQISVDDPDNPVYYKGHLMKYNKMLVCPEIPEALEGTCLIETY